MSYKFWFLLVAIDAILLIFSFISRNILCSLISLFLALFLKRLYSKITFPKLTILGHEIMDKGINK